MQKQDDEAVDNLDAEDMDDEDDVESDAGKSAAARNLMAIAPEAAGSRLAEVSERSDEAADGSDSQPRVPEQAGHPYMSLEQRRLEAKRSYNRMNAARARQRTKQQLDDLSAEVDQYTARNIQLQRLNAELVRQVESLSNENMMLRQRLSMSQGIRAGVGSGLGLNTGLLNAAGSLQADPGLSPLLLQQQLSAASNNRLQHQALMQSFAQQHSNLLDAPSLLSQPQDPSLASVLARQQEEQRLLASLRQSQQQPPMSSQNMTSILDQLTPAQQVLLRNRLLQQQQPPPQMPFGQPFVAESASANTSMPSPLLQALLARQQQQQGDGNAVSGELYDESSTSRSDE